MDWFDFLPDSLLLVIFNKLADIKTLGRCCIVSKRFNSLVPQVENVSVRVDSVISAQSSGILGHLLKVLQHLVSAKKTEIRNSPAEILKSFKEIRRLKIELPAGDLAVEKGSVLKWRAEFGSSLVNCVIFCVKSMGNQKSEFPRKVPQNGDENLPESFYTNGGLKLRVVWTISSLIAASARHYLLRQIINEHPLLESLILTDRDGQGTLCMAKEQLHEFRKNPLEPAPTANRTLIPALSMKLNYAARLDLPGGVWMQGATLVAIRPSGKEETKGFVCGAFDESPYGAAIAALVQRQAYLLEMNSF